MRFSASLMARPHNWIVSILVFALVCSTTRADNEDFIRKHAKEVAAEFAPNLPMQVSKNLTIRTVTAFDTTLSMAVKLAYDYDYLKSAVAASGVTPESLKPKMQVMTTNMVCSDKLLSAFVRLGGEVQYIYQFNDGVQYMVAAVEECSS